MVAKEKNNLSMERYFTRNLGEGQTVYDAVEWSKSDVVVKDETGKKIVFEQKDVEAPVSWSQQARQIAASKYFYGDQRDPTKRESSIKDMVSRVSETYAGWAEKDGYFTPEDSKIFGEELSYLLLHQYLSPNSPSWFNVGLDRLAEGNPNEQKKSWVVGKDGNAIPIPRGHEYESPQTAACFIQHLGDTMEDIMQLAENEAMLFKYGSGSGTDLSNLRSSKETISGGGTPSGPLSFMKVFDTVASVIKSGGKTRRAAKMQSLKIDHPDIENFIICKSEEEQFMRDQLDRGYSPAKAEDHTHYQNANLSVRVSDEFMEAVEKGEEWQTVPVNPEKSIGREMPIHDAKGLLRKISQATHYCGDPGLQFDTTINDSHTCINSGRINASNPCSEYMFVDDSSCNLASINLMKFVNEEGSFDIEGFKRATRLMAIFQDLQVDNSSYPTQKIAENSHSFRPLGAGYGNLGATLMKLGLPYDSDEGRTFAASVTSLESAVVYETSRELARNLGAFNEFEKNKDPMLNVIKQHRDASKNLDSKMLENGLSKIVTEANSIWEENYKGGADTGFRNAQATVLAPTGTIAFLMDCDTTGVEPDIALVKYKQLADGGYMKIVNQTVGPALKRLGYNENQVKDAVQYINKNDTIEGWTPLKEDHLKIFDCAFKPENGKRKISPKGHLEMMAAVQPYLSGAISKTVNLPEKVTVDEIMDIYTDAWKLKLKSVALYRDNSKTRQPLTLGNKGLEQKVKLTEEEMKIVESGRPIRRKLPQTRHSITHKFEIGMGNQACEGYLTVGLYDNMKPGEIFINIGKEGNTIGGMVDGYATAISLLLQQGTAVKELSNKFQHTRFSPSGLCPPGKSQGRLDDLLEHPHEATSVLDYTFNFLETNFPDGIFRGNVILADRSEYREFTFPGDEKIKKEKAKENHDSDEDEENKRSDGLTCPTCQGPAIRIGRCDIKCVGTCKQAKMGECGDS